MFHGVSKNITIQKLIEAIKMKNFDLIDEYIFNDLESTALRICPQLAEVFQKIDSFIQGIKQQDLQMRKNNF